MPYLSAIYEAPKDCQVTTASLTLQCAKQQCKVMAAPHVVSAQLCHCSWKIDMENAFEHSCSAIKLYLWTFTCKFSIAFMAGKIVCIVRFFGVCLFVCFWFFVFVFFYIVVVFVIH